jgi:hypothetical protein
MRWRWIRVTLSEVEELGMKARMLREEILEVVACLIAAKISGMKEGNCAPRLMTTLSRLSTTLATGLMPKKLWII